MGAGKSGFFKNTKGALDTISDLLVAASFIPGADMITNAISVPVDLLRGDYLSAGFSALGVIPLVGEVGDAAKVARVADKASDATKVVNKTLDIAKLPKSPAKLIKNGWKETTSAAMKRNTTSRTFKKDGLTIRFDKGKKGVSGYGGKDHYHILNPNSTGKHDYYLDKHGNPVPKNSKASHILP